MKATKNYKKYEQGGKNDPTERFLKTRTKKIQSPSKLDAFLRAELENKTKKAKPAVKIKLDPIQRVSKVAKDSGKGYGTVAYDAISSDGFQSIPFSERTFGDVANAAEKMSYKIGGKIYKDGGLALFKALKKKFGYAKYGMKITKK